VYKKNRGRQGSQKIQKKVNNLSPSVQEGNFFPLSEKRGRKKGKRFEPREGEFEGEKQ